MPIIKRQANGRASQSRIAGLDTIRLGAAGLVAMSHGMLIPPQIYANQGTSLSFWSGQIGHLLASGTGAVALFFVLSGLCIHLGREAAQRDPLLFLVRRMIRIGLPLISILLIIRLAGDAAMDLERGVLWSVYCEIAFYLAYPLLLVALRRWSIERMLFASVATSAALLAILPSHPLVWQYGYWTPLVCYPLWILGVMLAETVPSITPTPVESVWRWRLGLVLAASGCSLVRHMPWAVNLSALTYVVVGILAVPFLRREIAHAMAIAPSRLVERLGAASYSIYLVHRLPVAFVEHALVGWPRWIVAGGQLSLVAACSFTFFKLAEQPALHLARTISFDQLHRKWYRSAL